MGSKGGSSGGVTERRLRPLWDAIDTKQYKTALKLVSALLLKHPHSPYLLVLKALVLERMGKAEEALSLCQRAKECGPVDDLTLSTLQIVFHRLDRLDQATFCYEHACASNPKNLDLTTGLFNCYVREYSYLKQQQIAMKLYKLFGEERFLLWAVCSIQLQVFCGNGDQTLLHLAEALLKKRIDSHGLQELEALLVYLSILEHQGKYEAALDCLSTKLGHLFSISSDRLKLQGKYLLSSHQYKHAAEVFQEVLRTSSDDWTTLMQFLDAVSTPDSSTKLCTNMKADPQNDSLLMDNSCSSKEKVEASLQMAGLFIKELQETEVHELRRGPFLGSIEIAKRYLLLEHPVERSITSFNASGLADAILYYFNRFGQISSFASDVKNYLDLLGENEKIWLLREMQKVCSGGQDDNTLMLYRRKLTMHQIEVLLGIESSSPSKGLISHTAEICKLYIEGLELSKNLDYQESVYGEELLTLLANFLIKMFWCTKNPGYLLEAILVLEFGLSLRRHTFEYKIMLIHLYCSMSAVSSALDWYKTLDVKNILIETMSHHMLPVLLKSTLWSEMDSVLTESIRFYEDYCKEAADLTILAYRHCNYSKVLELVEFKNRLQRSHNYLLLKVENALFRLKQKANNPEEFELVFENMDYGHQMLEWSKDEKMMSLSFNEDLETRPCWSPAPDECLLAGEHTTEFSKLGKLSESESLQRRKRWRCNIRRRCLLPRLIYLSLQVVSVSLSGNTGNLVSEMQLLLQEYAMTFGVTLGEIQNLLDDVSSSRTKLKEVSINEADLVSLAIFYTAYQLVCLPISSDLLKSFGLLNTLVTNLLSELTKTVNQDHHLTLMPVIAPGSFLLSLVSLVTEAFAWLGLCLQVWMKSLQPAGKKKKKAILICDHLDVSANGNISMLSDVIQDSISIFCEQLEGIISWLTEILESPEQEMVIGCMASLNMATECLADPQEDVMPAPGYIISHLKLNSRMTNLGPKLVHLSTWEPEQVVRCLVGSQYKVLSDLRENTSSRLKGLKAVKA